MGLTGTKCIHVPTGNHRSMSEHHLARANGHAQLRILEALDGAGNVSQRELADEARVAASQVNRIIRGLVEAGRLRVVDNRVRPYAYTLTEEGREHFRRLSRARYDAVVTDFLRVQRRIADRLTALRREGVRRVALYGAGDILDVARPLIRSAGLEVVAVVDDDPRLHGTHRGRLTVTAPECLADAWPEAVVITSFQHVEGIRGRLQSAAVKVVEL
jgi:DNA-binding MarR family transcriptional regulator